MIRVNHAGEFGAKRIYEGQLKYTKGIDDKLLIKHMLEQEMVHLRYFEAKIISGSRPTLLLGLWYVGGYLLGSISSRLGNKTAMLVTESVEEVIEQHYQQQIDCLSRSQDHPELLAAIRQFLQDETDHKHLAVKHESQNANFASIVSKIVKVICRSAIALSQKI